METEKPHQHETGFFEPFASCPAILRVIAPISIVILVFLAFAPALKADFVNWDDYGLLFEHVRYRSLSVANLKWMFQTSAAGHFQPLTWLSYAIDYQVWGLDPFGFHLSNIALHALTALLVYFVARRLLVGSVSIISGAGQYLWAPSTVAAAWLAAVLFAVHPLRAESVAWVSERRDVLSGAFYLLSVLCYLRFAQGDRHGHLTQPHLGGSRKSSTYYGCTVATCALSLLAKATAVTLPFVLLVLDVYPLRRVRRTTHARSRRSSRVMLEKLPLFVLALLAGISAVQAQSEVGGMYSLVDHDWSARGAQALYGLTFYMEKSFWPSRLGPLYEIPLRGELLGPMFWGSISIVTGLLIIALANRKTVPGIGAALGVYAIVLAPVLGFLQSGPQFVADRYSYISCIGLAVLAGGVLMHWLGGPAGRPTAIRRFFAIAASGSVVVLLLPATMAQATIWESPLTLWQRGVAVSPRSGIAHVCLADALAVAKAPHLAKEHYERGLEINAKDAVAWHHLGDLEASLSHPKKAIDLYLQALKLDPNRSRACLSLARLLVAAGRPEPAVQFLRDGARRNPRDTDLVEYLADLLATYPDDQIRNGAEALEWARLVISLRGSRDVDALATLGAALAETGKFDQAITVTQGAQALAERHGDKSKVEDLSHRLLLYIDTKPYRMPKP